MLVQLIQTFKQQEVLSTFKHYKAIDDAPAPRRKKLDIAKDELYHSYKCTQLMIFH